MYFYRVSLALIVLFIVSFSVESFGEEDNVIISISTTGEAKVVHNLKPKSTVSSINVQTISSKISNILATEPNGTVLGTDFQGNSVRIATLGATSVKLSYNADIISKERSIWRLSFDSNIDSVVSLPPLSQIVSVNNIPINIVEDSLVMPAGHVSISYTIPEVVAKNFHIYEDQIEYTVLIVTASRIGNLVQDSNSLSFIIEDKAPILVILPKTPIQEPIEISLNNKMVDYKNYYQNNTHSWIRIDPTETGSILIMEKLSLEQTQQVGPGSGCLIATATYGSELATQVQFLREIRDNTVLSTESGTSFIESFNQFYYSFSPTIADWERQNLIFKEAVKLTITPLIATLSILQYVDIDSEAEMLGYGIGIIMLNIGMYFVVPAVVITRIKRVFSHKVR